MTYAKLPGLTWDGTVYENEEMCTSSARCCRMTVPSGWSR